MHKNHEIFMKYSIDTFFYEKISTQRWDQTHPSPSTDSRGRQTWQDRDHHCKDRIHVQKENIGPSHCEAVRGDIGAGD